jgi:hypothetical protein
MKQRHIIKKNYKTAAENGGKKIKRALLRSLYFLSEKRCLEFYTNRTKRGVGCITCGYHQHLVIEH